MSSLARKSHPILSSLPRSLTWRAPGFRTICSSRRGFASDTVTAGVKVLDTYKEEFEIGSRLITLETGKMARFANGAVVFGIEETKVLSTVTSGKGDAVRDFLPLTVDYQEKQFAQSVIPTTFMRREGAPKERELLCGRLIDRPIRPLFPSGFYHEVQVMASVLSSDGKQDPDIMAANATSAALMLSDIPWGGPIGVIRIGRISGQFIVNPTTDELNLSDLNLVYACTRDKTLMIDVQAREISEKDLEAGLRLAHPEAVKYLEPQIRLAAKAGKQKKEYKLSMMPEKMLEKVTRLAEKPIQDIFTDSSYGKFERGEALEKIAQNLKKSLEEECDEESLNLLPKTVDTVRKQVVRRRIIGEGIRLDGRRLDEVRPIYCESRNLPILHGSSLFSRGDTQVLCTVTMGAPGDAQRLDSLVGPPTKRFMLHYSFPPFCINEVGKRGGLNRREVGHGTLAEKALLAVLPSEDDFPYAVRINSEVMASDGSTSMATVCGGSIALMDAGIPLREHVAGISVGLVSEVDSSTGEIIDYRILTDILGLEDHLGDMDFKVAGTRNGVTAIQLDIKPAGIPLDIICESLEPARKGRLQILDHMEREINVPRTQEDRNSPRLASFKYANDALRRLIGPLGAQRKKIEEETGARISVGNGVLTIVAKNQSVMEKVQEKVDFIIGREIEVGGIYKGIVSSVREYGAFVEFNGGQRGLLHVSQLSDEPVRITDVVSIGQQLSVMCIGQDVHGNIKLSLKATFPESGSETKKVVESSATGLLTLPESGSETKKVVESSATGLLSSLKEELSASLAPDLMIRSAAECDKMEKSADASSDSSSEPKLRGASKQDLNSSSNVKKSKSSSKKNSGKKIDSNNVSENENENDLASQTDFNSDLSDKEAEVEPRSKSKLNGASKRDQNSSSNVKKSKSSSKKNSGKKVGSNSMSENETDLASQTHIKEAEVEARVIDKTLKLGSKVTGKVFQIRAHGLVLDLGGGIRGMFRFENDDKNDFKIGDELKVLCSSFSGKGIPVMSLADKK